MEATTQCSHGSGPGATSAIRLLRLVAGFAIWALAFLVLYGTNAVGCRFGWDATVQRALLFGLLAAHLAAQAALAWRWRRAARPARAADSPVSLIDHVGYGLMLAALAATVLSLLPGLLTTMCEP